MDTVTSFSKDNRLFHLSALGSTLGLLIPLLVGCAVPPAPLASTATNSGSSGSSSSSSSNQSSGNPVPINFPNAVSNSSTSTTSTSSTTTATPLSAALPTCTFSTPTIKSANGSYYYVDATLNVTSLAIQIAYVSYSVTMGSGSSGGSVPLGTSTSPPYEIQYSLSQSTNSGTESIVATPVDVNGQSYPSLCTTSFTINWK